MALKIDSKIVGYKVLTEEEKEKDLPAESCNDDNISDVEKMHENLDRPEMLFGSTYKIKTPQSEHALYITINDMILNMGTEHEERRPYEVFINSKNMEHFQWVLALTRVISAVFRKGGDACFLVEELKAVFDPRGGYYKKGGKYMPSIVAEIGEVIQKHLVSIGMMEGQLQTEELIAKRAEAEEKLGKDGVANAAQCDKCSAMAVVRLDNCNCCLECGDSKCG